MKINLIGMILNNCDARAFAGAIVDDDGKALNAADSLHAMILEYARVWNGHESSFVALHHSNANPPVGGACTTCGSDCNERDELIKAEREIDRLRANQNELAECKQLLRDIDANMRRAWDDRSLSANAWPTDLAQRLAKAVNQNQQIEAQPQKEQR